MEQFNGYLAAILQGTLRMANPLPDLCTRDLDRRSILHQIIDWYAARATEPRFEVLQTDADIIAQPLLGNPPFWYSEQVICGDMHIITLLIDLIWRFHDRVKFRQSDRDKSRMCNPGSVMSIGGLALLVGMDARKCLFIGNRIILYWDLGCHTANCRCIATVAGLDCLLRGL